RVSPTPVDAEGQLEGDVVRPVQEARGPFEIEPARRNRGGPTKRAPARRSVDRCVVDGDGAIGDLECDGELVEWRASVAEVAARERAPLEAAQKLLDIHAREPAPGRGAGVAAREGPGGG